MFHAKLTAATLVACCGWLSTSAHAVTPFANEFLVADGLEVTLWAESPLLFKPTNIDVDARGRVWVAEAVNYRTFRGTDANQPTTIPFRHPGGDRIVILEDTDGDGAADSSKVFVQDQDLVAPLGVAVIGDRVFVSCSPHLLVYTLDAGGDKPARREIFLTGFGGHDHDHGLHSVVAGPDGRLYFNAGNAGPHLVTDRDGKTFRAGSIYTGGSPHNPTNTPNLKSDDGRVWTGGVALRVEPDGRRLTPLAHNFRNAYEVAVDSFGDLWQSDNDDEVRACRTSWLMEGANLGFFSADGTRTWRADQRPGQPLPIAHWHQDDPGVLPAGDIYGAGGPTGVAVYEGDLLPALRGVVLNCDAGRNTVFAHRAVPSGAGYRLERSVWLTSQRGSTEGYVWSNVSMQDRGTWFRPSDVAVGTDGAVYVADWQDAVVGGHAMRSTNGYGRILRIAPKGSNPRPPRLDLSSRAGLLAAMESPAINVRFAARERLLANSAEASAVLDELARSTNPVLRARAVWFPGRWENALNDPEERVRVAAWRAARWKAPTKAWTFARRVIGETVATNGARSAQLLREFALTLRDSSFQQASPLLLGLAGHYDGKDRFYLEALGLGCDGKEEALYPLLLAKLGDADPLKWSDAFADLIWRLHPAASVPALLQRAGANTLSPGARLEAVDTLAFIRDRTAAEAMLALTTAGPADVRATALWWAQFRAGNEWKSFDIAARLPTKEPSSAGRSAQAKLQFLRRMLLDAGAPLRAREQAATELGATEAGGLALLQLASKGQLPAQLRDAVAEIIFRNPSPGVRAMASEHFKRPARGGETFPSVAELLTRRGDAARGAKVFSSESAACAKCHAFHGGGGGIGPDLTTVRTKLGREGTLDAILNPSAVIAAGYEPWLVETRDGEVYSGFVLADGEVVSLKELTGIMRVIPAKDITSRQQQKLSLMPDNIALGLTPGELVDLLAYLVTDPSSGGDGAPGSLPVIVESEARGQLEWIFRGRTQLAYAFAPDQFKPYVRQLRTVRGEEVLRDAPADHLHHHGLMYAIRVNGVNFWEEVNQPGHQRHVAWLDRWTGRSARGLPQARFTELIHWLPHGDRTRGDSASAAFLVERRTLTLTVDEANDEVSLAWHAEFEVGGRTNLVTLHGSDYNGLGLRLPADWDHVARQENSGQAAYPAGGRPGAAPARWGSVSRLAADGRATQVALLAGPRGHAGTNCFFAMTEPFTYLSATQGLDTSPLQYRAGDRFSLDYLVLVHSRARTRTELEARYQTWSKELE